MFSSILVLLLAASTAFGERSLRMRLSGASSFSCPQSAIVTTTLTNMGDEALILLNDPNSILSDMPTDKFTISHDNGGFPRFVGVLVDYVPEEATSFTTLVPGQSISLTHSLADAYDFTHSGSGEYSIEPASSAFLVLAEDGVREMFAETIAHTAYLSSGIRGDSLVQEAHYDYQDTDYDELDDSNDADVNDDEDDDAIVDDEDFAPPPRRPRFFGCSAARQQLIIAATRGAQNYARNSYNYLRRHNTTSRRYREWFGTFNPSRRKRLVTNFQKISRHNFGTAAYNCSCNQDNLRAYVYPNRLGVTWLCPAYWRMPATGPSNKAGTLVHEASHWTATADTDDVVYGQTAARDLARRNPGRAIQNADSHRFFAENLPALP